MDVTTRKTGLPVNAADLPMRATAVLDPPAAATGRCAEAVLDAQAPAPVCAFSRTGTRLVCR